MRVKQIRVFETDESDPPRNLAVEETYHRHVTTPAQSVTTLSRDLAQSLCRNAGCWRAW